MTSSNHFTFLHFNDVYNVEKAPSFVTSIKRTRTEVEEGQGDNVGRDAFVVFGGDAFSPSIMSTILRGEQMVPALNAIGIDVACLGNHDLDFGLQEFRELREQCNFPWLCSNACDAGTGKPLGGCLEYIVLEGKREGGPKLLAIGLIEDGWLDTLATIDPGDVVFEPPADYVRRRLPELRAEHGPFDAVVAVTHMRMPNDIELATEAGPDNGGVDIVLGGHDHHYEDVLTENGVRVLNSGSDFRSYTVVDVRGRHDSDSSGAAGALDTASRRVDVNGEDDAPDESVAEAIRGFKDEVDQRMDVVVGRSKVRLDARFAEIRRRETNVSNFLAELMTRATGADVALLNAGSIRADRFLEKGEMSMRDLCDLLPMPDETIVIEVTGERLLFALENGVSQYPAMEGRFPCVDGVRFAFDPSKPAGSRVVPGSVYVRDRPVVKRRHTIIRGRAPAAATENGADDEPTTKEENVENDGAPKGYSPVDPDRSYSLVTKAYLAEGKDGFDRAFVGAPVLIDEESAPLLPTLLRNIFTELRILEMWKGMTVQATVVKAASAFKRLARRSVADPYAINPQVDGRIRNLVEEAEN